MRELDGRRMLSRVKGRQALERSLAGLLIRTHRYATRRAQTTGDQHWAGRVIAGLQKVLQDMRMSDKGITQ